MVPLQYARESFAVEVEGAAGRGSEEELQRRREGAEGGRRPIWNRNGAVRGEERLEESRGTGEGEEEGEEGMRRWKVDTGKVELRRKESC